MNINFTKISPDMIFTGTKSSPVFEMEISLSMRQQVRNDTRRQTEEGQSREEIIWNYTNIGNHC